MYVRASKPTKDDITLIPIQSHETTVIWLHGFGDSAYGWVDIFDNIEMNPFLPTTKIILLTAPLRNDL